MDHVDRERHPDGVDRVARSDDEAVAGGRCGPAEQPSGASQKRVGQVGPLREHDAAREVHDPHLPIGHRRAPVPQERTMQRPGPVAPCCEILAGRTP